MIKLRRHDERVLDTNIVGGDADMQVHLAAAVALSSWSSGGLMNTNLSQPRESGRHDG
jgi:hypothetical protein